MALRLIDIPREPVWLDLLMGVRVRCRPPSTALDAAAMHRARQEVVKLAEDAISRRRAGLSLEDMPDLNSDATRAGYIEYLYTLGLAESVILDWEGVEDAEGDPAPVNEDNIRRLIEIPALAGQFRRLYLASLDDLRAEGNDCAPGPNGKGRGARSTAGAARGKASPARKEGEDPAGSDAPSPKTSH